MRQITEFLRVKNFEKYQHYSKRRPPWIKLYYTLLSSPNVVALSDSCRYHVVAIMLLASQYNNELPFNKTWISRVIQANSRINWDEVLSSGLIECYQGASTVQANSSLETETETETETYKEETDSKVRVPVASLPKCSLGKNCNGKRESCAIEFEKFWSIYPRHEPGKTETLKSFCRVHSAGTDIEIICKWISKAKAAWTEKRFIPYATTFLNNKRWEGDLPLQSSNIQPEPQYEKWIPE